MQEELERQRNELLRDAKRVIGNVYNCADCTSMECWRWLNNFRRLEDFQVVELGQRIAARGTKEAAVRTKEHPERSKLSEPLEASKSSEAS